MPAKKELTVTGNAKEVVDAAGEVALKLAASGKLEQATLQIVLPCVFGMIRIRDKVAVDGSDDG